MTSFSVGPHLCWFGVSDIGLCLGCRQTANNIGQMQILCKMEAQQNVLCRLCAASRLDNWTPVQHVLCSHCAKWRSKKVCSTDRAQNCGPHCLCPICGTCVWLALIFTLSRYLAFLVQKVSFLLRTPDLFRLTQ